MFDECVTFFEKDGAFDPTTVGCCPNVDLMAPKALWNVSWPCARCEARETDETTSAMVKLARDLMSRCPNVINTVEVPQIQYIDRAVDVPVVRGRW